MFTNFYNAVFYHPIFNLLIGLYDYIPGRDIGLAIILLTILVKLAMWPLQASALRSQKALTDIQPKIEELKKRYPEKSQQEELAKEMMALYSREKVNPAASCLPLLIQLPVFIALYHALSAGLKSGGFEALYPFIPNPGTITPTMFGLLDLAAPNYVLAILAGAMQYFQAKMMVTRQQPKGVPGGKDEQMLATMNKQMVYMMPALTVFIGWTLPGGLSLYWFVMSGLTVLQQFFFFKKHPALKVETPHA
jgi:YidC/Oxa1 family membrane protein insertase